MTVKGLTTPKRVGCVELLFLCRYEGLARSLLLDWYLGSKKLREILTLLCCITLSSSRENQHSAQEVARRISGPLSGRFKSSQDLTPDNEPFLAPLPGSLRTSQDIPCTHHKLLSLALHYLPFASRFPLPHFTLAVLFALSLSLSSLSLFASFCHLLFCLCVSLFACRYG